MHRYMKYLHFGTTFLFEPKCVFQNIKNVLYFLKMVWEKPYSFT
jgi:hypothetical protein